jgi:hypothetical protein
LKQEHPSTHWMKWQKTLTTNIHASVFPYKNSNMTQISYSGCKSIRLKSCANGGWKHLCKWVLETKLYSSQSAQDQNFCGGKFWGNYS